MQTNYSFLMSDDGSLTIVNLDNGRDYSISPDHVNYNVIVERLDNEEYEGLDELMDAKQTIVAGFCSEESRVTVSPEGVVCFNGNEMHNAVTRRIVAYMRRGLPFDSLTRFLDRLMNNPSWNSVQQLFSFIDNSDMPITADGCFIAYKGVRNDWMDAHSGTMDNSVGEIVTMPRNEVQDDPQVACGPGLHAGSLSYARGHATRTILVKIDPSDCVSVPDDHNHEKLRCCRYEVVSEYTETEGLEEPLYQGQCQVVMAQPDDDWDGDDFDDGDDGYFC